MAVKMNINDPVWVKLTPKGFERHKEWHDELFTGVGTNPAKAYGAANYQKPVSANEWYHFRLWELMQIFGPVLHMGAMDDQMVFATEICLSNPHR